MCFKITGGKKVPVVYDSVGKDTFLKSLDCLAPLGVAALFGQSSGAVEPLNLGLLAGKGSLYVTRPTLGTYAAKRENLVAMANELFDVVKSGAVKIEVNQTYPLKDAAKAHTDSVYPDFSFEVHQLFQLDFDGDGIVLSKGATTTTVGPWTRSRRLRNA